MSKEGGAAGILEAAVRGRGSQYGQRKGGIGWIKGHAGRYGSERADLLVRIAVEQDPRPGTSFVKLNAEITKAPLVDWTSWFEKEYFYW